VSKVPADGPGPLYHVIETFVRDEYQKLDQDRLVPWSFFHANGVTTKDFYGHIISYSGPLAFGGSARDVFWQLPQPFLRDIAVRTIDETVRRGEGKCDLHQALAQTEGLLIACSQKTFRRMSKIDRQLRGNGHPKSVAERDTSGDVAAMEASIKELVAGQVRLIKRPTPWLRDPANIKWLVGLVVTLAIALIGAVTKILADKGG
jgi:hypothetical protein